jgi:hypothetical protein
MMPGPELRWNVQGFSHMLKIRRLLTALVIIVLICSVQIVSFHHIDDSLVIHRACHICKVLAVFSLGGEAAVQANAIPDVSLLFFAFENLLIFPAVLPLVRGNRAPPYSLFSGTVMRLSQN